jgi:hypothetical protein
LKIIVLRENEMAADMKNEAGPWDSLLFRVHLAPIRERRSKMEKDPGRVRDSLVRGIRRARQEAEKILAEVRFVMNMDIRS